MGCSGRFDDGQAKPSLYFVWDATRLTCARTVKYLSPTTHLCILRVARDQYTLARGTVALLTSINGARVLPHIVHVSGAFLRPFVERCECASTDGERSYE